MTVLVIGEALVDVVTRPGQDPEPHAGGSPFNVAIGLSRLDVPTVLAAQIGGDRHGDGLRWALDDSHVTLAALSPVPDRTSTANATLGEDGSASYEFDLTWDPDGLPDPSAFDAVHVGSLGTALQPGAKLVAGLVTGADALGVPVSYDPNIRLTVEPDPQVWRAVFDAIAPHATILKMSDEDADTLFPGEAPADLARRLAAEHGIVAITCGSQGSLIAAGTAFASVPPADVRVVDTIGAGDSFMAAMLSWCAMYDWPSADELDDTELTDLALYASSAAAITCSRPGADPPWTAELTP
ncbi:carbohydrate kinase family protein [Aeromicrobium wangtongii]|uniref:Carbohydrate kinase n=1 Tax=Aeromicrobium wangtongii TaxID=2969247 RepID=A0ABY5MA57_9ACTN|nr:carbohydrate kinase [Aeromicrobium wangtongii]MCD9199927.1 carbohydrate kinase [Aeromicrobium wangtongii]UUP13543.1 carbohydrate kinase [Aeromicrobium wangtongii]